MIPGRGGVYYAYGRLSLFLGALNYYTFCVPFWLPIVKKMNDIRVNLLKEFWKALETRLTFPPLVVLIEW